MTFMKKTLTASIAVAAASTMADLQPLTPKLAIMRYALVIWQICQGLIVT